MARKTEGTRADWKHQRAHEWSLITSVYGYGFYPIFLTSSWREWFSLRAKTSEQLVCVCWFTLSEMSNSNKFVFSLRGDVWRRAPSSCWNSVKFSEWFCECQSSFLKLGYRYRVEIREAARSFWTKFARFIIYRLHRFVCVLLLVITVLFSSFFLKWYHHFRHHSHVYIAILLWLFHDFRLPVIFSLFLIVFVLFLFHHNRYCCYHCLHYFVIVFFIFYNSYYYCY